VDNRRTDYLKCNGWRILRFWNHEVLKEREAVLVRILGALEPPHPDPLPSGKGAVYRRIPPHKKRLGHRNIPSPLRKGAVYRRIPPHKKKVGTSQHPLSPQGRGLG
jgi:hypothetical protein